jgi:hypothetical protein
MSEQGKSIPGVRLFDQCYGPGLPMGPGCNVMISAGNGPATIAIDRLPNDKGEPLLYGFTLYDELVEVTDHPDAQWVWSEPYRSVIAKAFAGKRTINPHSDTL